MSSNTDKTFTLLFFLSVIILLCPQGIFIFVINLSVTFAQCDNYPQVEIVSKSGVDVLSYVLT